MARLRLEGEPPIDVDLRRSARARRLTLRVSRIDGKVSLTLPRSVPKREGLQFLREREGWLRGQLAGIDLSLRPQAGGTLPVEGLAREVRTAPIRSARLEGAYLLVPEAEGRRIPAVTAFLKALARERLTAASDSHAATLGVTYGRITLRDTRSRWGSCTARGDLMYSWRLAMAPPEVLDYVAAHEVAHLRRMDHSPVFWAIVADLCPDHARHRAWLRTDGVALHRIDLGRD